ncbi:general secretion pathway protein A [Silvibacterium bohemicum]|uniref:General secretion pathway protein A n=1 Tax=Silvibacterium bohemicum TaxID=1577686 RepID=A0A841JR44_9BACT|nr:AAA family ATPase [Silvibacterium bohemicum]MBB6142885.1 general secretion pathway protein A [Silvibacterium bohemicum]
MYKAFFNLARNPFELTPDPEFLFSTQRHNEALAALYYGVRRHKGFVVVTGEVGTGKTLMLRCLLRLLKQSKDVTYAYVFNSLLSPTEFLQYVLSDFGRPVSGKNKGELLLDLGQFVISQGSKNLTTVLVVDEAHHLSADLLEEIRLLTNLETTEDKLLQVVLVGQPELDEKLDSIGLRQLKQRIALRARLGPLDEDETEGYIERRLQIAGLNSRANTLFSPQAISDIHFHSRGFPRLINTICENALISAYARQIRIVTPDIIEDVAREFRLNVLPWPETERFDGRHGKDIQQATSVLPDLYSSLLRPTATESEPGAPLSVHVSKHEPSF